MNEKAKIDEAAHFLAKMKSVENQPDAFKFELSAFLSAARSALQYALEEARSKGGQAWYDQAVSALSRIRFLKEKRDISIHDRPVVPSKHISSHVHDVMHVSDQVSHIICRADGTVEIPPPSLPPVPFVPPVIEDPPTTYSYSFSDWSGPEDVLALCEQYLADVRVVVAEGISIGHITR